MFKQYRRKEIAELRPYIPGESLSDRVSISAKDRENGSPKEGDMIARSPKSHGDQWLVAKAYFLENFEPLETVYEGPGEVLSFEEVQRRIKEKYKEEDK